MTQSLYSAPHYYDLAFSFRDIAAEASFLRDVVHRYSSIPVTSVLEIACGTAPHAGTLIDMGWRYIGLDLNSTMLAHGAKKWHKCSPKPEWILADMMSFAVTEPVDFAFIMLGSLYCQNRQDMDNHLDCVAKALKPGGLYFLDWCIEFHDPLALQRRSEIVQEMDGVTIRSIFDTHLADPSRHLFEERWYVQFVERGEEREFEMVERNKALYPHEFLLLLESRKDFRFVDWWEDWDFARPIAGSVSPTRPIVVIQRT